MPKCGVAVHPQDCMTDMTHTSWMAGGYVLGDTDKFNGAMNYEQL